MTTSDKIHIFLRDCTVPLFVGIYDHERPKAQNIIINIEAIAPLTQHYNDLKSSAITSVINYERLYDFVTAVLPNLGHVPLLESIAERIVTYCLEDARITEVRVRLDKPEAFKDKALAGVELHRYRRTA